MSAKKQYQKKAASPGFKDIQADLAGDSLPNVIMLYGPENYLMRWMAGQIVERYVPEAVRAFDYTDIRAYKLESVGGIIDACEMLPVMSEKKIVLVTELNPKVPDLDVLIRYIPDVPDSTILIFIQEEMGRQGNGFSGAVKKAGKAYELTRVDRRTLAGFIRKYLKQEGVSFQPDAVNALIEVSGYYDKDSGRTLDNIRAEVTKIAAHSSGMVTAEDVAEAVMPNEERDVFSFTDALTAGNKARAMEMLKILLSYGGSEFNILGLICSQFETMMMIREALELGRPGSFLTGDMKLNAYRVRLLSNPASRYSSNQLKEILKKAYEVDRLVKTGRMEASLALELFVAEV